MIILRYVATRLHCGEHVRELGFEHSDSQWNNILHWKHPEGVTMQIYFLEVMSKMGLLTSESNIIKDKRKAMSAE